MSHPEMEAQVDAYLDGELAPADAAEVEAHLVECAACARFRTDRLALRSAIVAAAPRGEASAALRGTLGDAIRREAAPATRLRPASRSRWTWLAAAATVALVAMGSWRLGASRAAEGELADQVLASHVRSLMPGHLSDVVSSDQHTVKPWFDGRLDFSPPVHDFAGRGYPLLGGRMDYVGGRAVAALAYGRRKHVISVFLWPTPASGSAPQLMTRPAARQGYHLLHWTTPDFTYWVASDLGLAELNDFAGLLQSADSATGT